jgi:hypothetical protein
MQTPKDFFDSLGGTLPKVGGEPVATMPALYEAMRLYGEYVAKETRHAAAEIALNVRNAEMAGEAHRDIMNLRIK